MILEFRHHPDIKFQGSLYQMNIWTTVDFKASCYYTCITLEQKTLVVCSRDCEIYEGYREETQ